MKDFPTVYVIENRKIDDQYYLCNSNEDIKQAALDGFETLHDMSLLYPMEQPDPERYGEVTDEMIENAPSYEVKSALEKTKQNRETWLNGSTWDKNSLQRQQHLYSLYKAAKTGSGGSAYHYLLELGVMREINLNTFDNG